MNQYVNKELFVEALQSLNERLDEVRNIKLNLIPTSKAYQEKLKEEIRLLNDKKKLLDNEINNYKN